MLINKDRNSNDEDAVNECGTQASNFSAKNTGGDKAGLPKNGNSIAIV